MAKEIKIVTIKPLASEVEYGVQENGQWLVHGVVIPLEVGPATTGEQIMAAATADAQAKGLS
jgi:hypothetical protein